MRLSFNSFSKERSLTLTETRSISNLFSLAGKVALTTGGGIGGSVLLRPTIRGVRICIWIKGPPKKLREKSSRRPEKLQESHCAELTGTHSDQAVFFGYRCHQHELLFADGCECFHSFNHGVEVLQKMIFAPR
jgi:hypothetical protein